METKRGREPDQGEIDTWIGDIITYQFNGMRQKAAVGAEAKKLKQQINTKWIYPPSPDRAEAFAAADPTRRLV